MNRGVRAGTLGGIVAAAVIWLACFGTAVAQQPEEIPGLEDLDSIPAASGFRTMTRRTVFIDSAGVRSDSAIKERNSYDGHGRLLTSAGYGDAGEELYRQTYTYETRHGRVTRSSRMVNDDDEPAHDWRYLYDAAGRISGASDSISQVVIHYGYGKPGGAAPCLAITVTGRYRFSGIDSYCDASGRIARQVGYIGSSDTVIATLEYPSSDSRRRRVQVDGRVREWLYTYDSTGHILSEEYRAGRPDSLELVYRVDSSYRNGLLQHRECRNYGSLDWIDYYEYR